MTYSIDFTGQWIGHFAYGPQHGGSVAGEKVQFRLFIKIIATVNLLGSVDIEGAGANFEEAQIKGYIDKHFISFTKEYSHFYGIDQNGNTIDDIDRQHPVIAYSGDYKPATKTFAGEWEMRIDIEPVGDHWLENVYTGTWEIYRDD